MGRHTTKALSTALLFCIVIACYLFIYNQPSNSSEINVRANQLLHNILAADIRREPEAVGYAGSNALDLVLFTKAARDFSTFLKIQNVTNVRVELEVLESCPFFLCPELYALQKYSVKAGHYANQSITAFGLIYSEKTHIGRYYLQGLHVFDLDLRYDPAYDKFHIKGFANYLKPVSRKDSLSRRVF